MRVLLREWPDGNKRQEPFTPFETLLRFFAMRFVNHRSFRKQYRRLRPQPRSRTRTFVQASAEHCVGQMANLDGSRPNGAKDHGALTRTRPAVNRTLSGSGDDPRRGHLPRQCDSRWTTNRRSRPSENACRTLAFPLPPLKALVARSLVAGRPARRSRQLLAAACEAAGVGGWIMLVVGGSASTCDCDLVCPTTQDLPSGLRWMKSSPTFHQTPSRVVSGSPLGYVQSGKTTAITALMAEAADNGVRIVIALLGSTNLLLDQNVSRIENALGIEAPGHYRWYLIKNPKGASAARRSATGWRAIGFSPTRTEACGPDRRRDRGTREGRCRRGEHARDR